MASQTILLIDFDTASIDRAKTSLTAAGFHVEVARDGISGLEAFERVKPDLVLVEAMLPRKHGFEVCQQIKQTDYGKCTPILVTSQESRETKYVAEAQRLYGCDEYIEKPLAAGVLVELCRKLLPQEEAPEPTRTRTPANVSLDDLTEDELMERLDGLIDAVTVGDEEVGAADAQDPVTADADLVSLCERVFPVGSDDDAASQGNPHAASSRPALTEEEVMEQLDALITRPKTAAVPPATPQATPKAAPPPAQAAPPSTPKAAPAPAQAAPPSTPKATPAPPAQAPTQAAAKVAPPQSAPQAARQAAPSSPTVAKPAAAAPPRIDAPGPRPDPEPEEAVPPEGLHADSVLGLEPESREVDAQRRSRKLLWVTGVAAMLLAAVGLLVLALVRRQPAAASPKGPPVARTRPAPAHPASPLRDLRSGDPAEEVGFRSLIEDSPVTDGPLAPASTPSVEAAPAAGPRSVSPPAGEPAPTADREPAVPSRSESVSPVFSAKAAAPAPEIQPAASNPAPARKPPTEAPPRPSPSQALPVLAAPTPRPVDTEALFRIQHDEVAPPLEPEPSPSTRAGDLVPLDAVDSNPLPLSQPAPEYDPLSRRMRQEGTVTLELLIDERGRVVDVRHQGGSANQRLVEAAERGVRGWRYRPATKDGVPVKVWKPVDIEFRL